MLWYLKLLVVDRDYRDFTLFRHKGDLIYRVIHVGLCSNVV